MVPHKAWAAGDRVTAVVKFSPLVKGARVQNVTTMINETVKLFGRAGGCQETTRTIATTKHDFHGARAVCVDEQHHRFRVPLLHHTAQSHSLTGSRGTSTPASPLQTNSGSSYFPPQPATHSPGEMTPLTTVTTNSSSSSSSAPHAGPSAGASSSSIGISPISSAPESEAHVPIGIELPAELEEEPSQDVVTTLHISVPLHATPAHALEPIQVSHRIRWSIMIGNLDGHTSELRCSLPLHLLDHRLYDEAHSATLQTRRLLLGAQDVEGGQAVDTHGEASDNEEDMELPSYPAHVRDRVANAYLPDTGIMRVTNPWIAQGISPVIMTEPRTESSSGLQSPAPLECFQINGAPPAQTGGSNPSVNPRNHLPQVPPPDAQQLHWVNSELLLSMTRQPDQLPASVTRRSPRESRPHSMTPPETTSIQPSRHGSRFPSRRPSRANSRSGSPERSSSDGASVHSADTYVHSSSTASRNLHGLFHMSMKPFTSLTSGFSLGHRSSSSNNLSSGYPHGHSHLGHIAATGHSPTDIRNSRSPSGNSTPISPGPHTPPLVNVPHRHMTQDQMLLHRAFIETPDYEIASRGFLGGGIPPLSSYTGLPSYEEAAESRASIERSMSEPDLISARAAPSIHAQLPPPEQLTGPVTAPPSPLGHAS
ncbi:hypothetical protein PHLCEN_2v10938 [Hermanssonia centrifuga]|uniref:Arrestin C-terminal-like domain-containing protein n=1 Tax=Hermanssonia centrifuga TaxID=98765 RepID=A0A2R6NLL7_9APHY|nr:hypothetical protein PHLCEN_2v10938 [Hermanssonia centrifuga]